MENAKRSEFEKSADEKGAGLFREFIGLMKQNKKYRLIPPFLILVLSGVLITPGSTVAAPFIYMLFLCK
jgi:hypothetical protein